LFIFLAVFLSGGEIIYFNSIKKLVFFCVCKGVISSWLSYVFKIVTKTPNISLGAVSIK